MDGTKKSLSLVETWLEALVGVMSVEGGHMDSVRALAAQGKAAQDDDTATPSGKAPRAAMTQADSDRLVQGHLQHGAKAPTLRTKRERDLAKLQQPPSEDAGAGV